MTTIVFATSKGGAGKTTAAVLLASELAIQGQKDKLTVTILDSDPNQHCVKWAKRGGCPKNISLTESVAESNMLDAIEDAENKSDFVIVDSEGSANLALATAVSRADLVIIPTQGSQDDADEAAKTIKLIERQSRVLNTKIPYAILLCRTSAVTMTKNLSYIIEEFKNAGVDIFETSLIDREAYRTIRSYGGSLYDLTAKDVSGLSKAIENAKAYVEEVKHKLVSANKNEQEGTKCQTKEPA